MLRILQPGLQATLQGAPRLGLRHLGVPYAGPADPLSMALANRIVPNGPNETALEITFGGFAAEVEKECSIAITGAQTTVICSGEAMPMHQTLHLKAGDILEIAPAKQGMRIYLAVTGGFVADALFGSRSTYLPAGFGGYKGRALQVGDQLAFAGKAVCQETLETPEGLQPVFTNSWALRACRSAETDLLDPAVLDALFGAPFTAGRQGTRMGVSLEGAPLPLNGDALMKSAAVYPGTIQCPPSGIPVVLLCDAQTTGGYPRIAHIARCDRHLLG
ncbi:MAG: biotin-dependent carboxyltransferase family protein, partial [Pseudomonadota bacterium]